MALGWRETIRCGVCAANINLYVTAWVFLRVCGASLLTLRSKSFSSRYNLSVYSPQVLDHFQNPRNPGEVTAPDASAQIENPVCGDVLKLTMKLDAGRIADIRFLAKGCVPAMACASVLTELVRNKTPGEARQLRREDLLASTGVLPNASTHAADLAMQALSAALKQL